MDDREEARKVLNAWGCAPLGQRFDTAAREIARIRAEAKAEARAEALREAAERAVESAYGFGSTAKQDARYANKLRAAILADHTPDAGKRAGNDRFMRKALECCRPILEALAVKKEIPPIQPALDALAALDRIVGKEK